MIFTKLDCQLDVFGRNLDPQSFILLVVVSLNDFIILFCKALERAVGPFDAFEFSFKSELLTVVSSFKWSFVGPPLNRPSSPF